MTSIVTTNRSTASTASTTTMPTTANAPEAPRAHAPGEPLIVAQGLERRYGSGRTSSQLAERGDPRAAEHARSISAMARSSLADVRALVRGYRDVDLPSELQGTLSLLRSAGISTHVHGEADDVPAEHAEAATWALREAGTNLLRHADATTVRITLGPDGMRVVNDGATPPASAAPTAIVEGSGLRGLRERLGPTRTLRTEQDGDTFTLDIRFTPEESHDQS